MLQSYIYFVGDRRPQWLKSLSASKRPAHRGSNLAAGAISECSRYPYDTPRNQAIDFFDKKTDGWTLAASLLRAPLKGTSALPYNATTELIRRQPAPALRALRGTQAAHEFPGL